MPRILGLLGLIATVMHIALGCCAHAGHEGSAGDHHAHHAFTIACESHDHHHHHHHETDLAAADIPQGEQVAAPQTACHSCDDEHCTSTLTLRVTLDAALHGGALVAELPQPAKVVTWPGLSVHLDIDPHAFTRLRAHALCARFLI
ncbi:MAG: hypothetical protein JNM18_12220 [Planctomycetaceae bacterium]|nr:hypothetical protein [Planctomycetaceae bacterium]